MRLVQKLATRPLVISWDSTIQSCFGRTLLPVRLHTPSTVPAAKMACWALKHDNPMILMAIVLNRSKLGWGISRALIVLPCCYPLMLLWGLNWEVTAIRMDGYNTDLNLRCNLCSSLLHEHDNFILIIRTMLRQNKVNPKHTITLTNREQALILLLTNMLPSAKEFNMPYPHSHLNQKHLPVYFGRCNLNPQCLLLA